jgi:DNA-binding transcriptional regulator YiaG
MAIIRRTAATTEADIRRHMSEDGDDESDFADFAPVIPPRVLRNKLHMTQTEFARALRISSMQDGFCRWHVVGWRGW